MIETILVATDGSDDASAAEQTAMGLASRLGARLSGVSVLDDRMVRAPSADGLALPPFPEADLTAYYRARVEAVARRFSERARGEGLESVPVRLVAAARQTGGAESSAGQTQSRG